LLKAGLGVGAALSVVLAADTLSIATMEIVDNAVMAIIPGAMDAGLVNVIFWVGMMIALTVAFFAAWPVNRYQPLPLAARQGSRPDPRVPRRDIRIDRPAPVHPELLDRRVGRDHRGVHARRLGRLNRGRDEDWRQRWRSCRTGGP